MDTLFPISLHGWKALLPSQSRLDAVNALESGQVLFFPELAFELNDQELGLLDPAILDGSKNVSYNSANDSLRGTICEGEEFELLKGMLARFSEHAVQLFQNVLSSYGNQLKCERTSFRPATVEGRVQTWRKDDTRLHVDSFPSTPTAGRRILRLFCNVNPVGRPRTWRTGEQFETVARRFWNELPQSSRITRSVLSLFRVTKSYRTDYDHFMLELHDAMKRDLVYQEQANQERIDFPAGSSWACYADQVSHAAMAGQFQFEQTFSLPVDAMVNPETSPLRTLERIAGRPLIDTPIRRAA